MRYGLITLGGLTLLIPQAGSGFSGTEGEPCKQRVMEKEVEEARGMIPGRQFNTNGPSMASRVLTEKINEKNWNSIGKTLELISAT